MFAKRVRQPLPSGCPTRRHEHKTTRQPKPAVAQRRPTAVAHACRTPCPAPVWWFERCAQNPIPSRTRPLNAPAPMVLCLKTRESRSPPDLHRTRDTPSQTIVALERPPSGAAFLRFQLLGQSRRPLDHGPADMGVGIRPTSAGPWSNGRRD